MRYGKSQNITEGQQFSGQRGQRDPGRFMGGANRGNQGGIVAGEVLSKDDKSLTVRLRDMASPEGQAGSRIIFFSNATEVGKFVDGTSEDIEVGKTIVASGTANQDGSFSATSIQLRPTAYP